MMPLTNTIEKLIKRAYIPKPGSCSRQYHPHTQETPTGSRIKLWSYSLFGRFRFKINRNQTMLTNQNLRKLQKRTEAPHEHQAEKIFTKPGLKRPINTLRNLYRPCTARSQ
jgi:hypothetical protein